MARSYNMAAARAYVRRGVIGAGICPTERELSLTDERRTLDYLRREAEYVEMDGNFPDWMTRAERWHARNDLERTINDARFLWLELVEHRAEIAEIGRKLAEALENLR